MLLVTTLTGMAFALPIRHRPLSMTSSSLTAMAEQYEYLSDWIQSDFGILLFASLILSVAVLLGVMMMVSHGEFSTQVQMYLCLQGVVAGLATLGILLLTKSGFPGQEQVYLGGHRALIMLGMWGSLGSLLWASGRLDRWLGTPNTMG
jgi:hypothetical protein